MPVDLIEINNQIRMEESEIRDLEVKIDSLERWAIQTILVGDLKN